MGKASVIVGIIAAVVLIAVVVVVIVIVIFGGIDTSPITEVSESFVVTVPTGDAIALREDYYYIQKIEGDTPDAHKFTFSLTYYNGDTKTWSFQNTETKRFSAFSDVTYIY